MVEKTIYICEHCNRKQLNTRRGMAGHELMCWYNPSNKTCITCDHGELTYNDLEKVRKCYSDKKNVITFDSIRPIEDCPKWVASNLKVHDEIPTPQQIAEIITHFNKMDYWCELSIKDNNILITDRESKEVTLLSQVDGVDRFKPNKCMLEVVFTEYQEEWKGCIISKDNIEYF